MATKINGVDTRPAAPVGAGRATQRTRDSVAGGAGGEAPAGQSPDVQITGAANRLASLEQSLLESPAVDEARVAEIRSAIEDGSYQVQPERVADGLMQFEQALAQLEK